MEMEGAILFGVTIKGSLMGMISWHTLQSLMPTEEHLNFIEYLNIFNSWQQFHHTKMRASSILKFFFLFLYLDLCHTL